MRHADKPESVVATANRVVPWARALLWTKLVDGMRERGMKVTCPGCDAPDAMMVYPDHAWCWNEAKWYGTVALLATCWKMDPETAASTALEKIGYRPPDPTDVALMLLGAEPEPARDELAEALRIFCRAECPDWATRQYDTAVALKLAQCLSVLPLVHSAEKCGKWLAVSKQAMARVIAESRGIT